MVSLYYTVVIPLRVPQGPGAATRLTRYNALRSILSHDPSLPLALGTPRDPGAGTDQGNRVRCGPLAWPEAPSRPAAQLTPSPSRGRGYVRFPII